MRSLLIFAALLSLPVRAAAPLAVAPVPMFTGEGVPLDWAGVFAAMDKADIVIIGESHTDARGHELQRQLIVAATGRWDGLVVSLEEFDRSQQQALTEYQRGELTDAQLKEVRDFVDPRIKKNWDNWYLPKVRAARDGDAVLVASNAPLKYSRMVRNFGCDDLPDLDKDELALFACPSVPVDPAYLERFDQRLQSIANSNKRSGLKKIGSEQTELMFRAQRVWDATMAKSIVMARAAAEGKVLHLVGSFHSDFEGGLIKELKERDPKARIVVICMGPKRSKELQSVDRGRADIVIYTRG